MRRIYFFMAAAIFFWGTAFSQPPESPQFNQANVVGEAFGKPVTNEEFIYYYKTALIFTRSGDKDSKEAERTDDERRQEAWQNLVFTKEAKLLVITVDKEELIVELKRLLSEKNIEYGTDQYNTWVASTFGESPEIFKQRIEDLLLVNKFTRIKMTPEVSVTEDEAKEKYLNQYNSFESEYILFESPEQAKAFSDKVSKNPKLWKETWDQKKPLGQKEASWINIMSLEALVDLWKIPKEDAYRILDHEPGDFIVAKFYYGDGVFRLLNKKRADISKYDQKKKQYYLDMLATVKKRKIAKEYFEDLIKRANCRDYVAEKRQKEKIVALKEKSVIILETTQGIVELKLFPDKAPLACENFVGLIEKGYYDGLIFHRVIKDFMIQGGDPTGTGTGGDSIWKKPFVDEVSEGLVFDKPGLIAMANSGPDANMSQFFITVKPTPHLNMRHTIFGEVVGGYNVVEKISLVDTVNDKPKKDVKIIRGYLKNKGQQTDEKKGGQDAKS